MPTPKSVRIKDIVDALEMQFDELPSFLDLDTGQVEIIPIDVLHQAEDDDDDDPDLQLAKRIVFSGRFVIRDELVYAIHGSGAFRMFKNIIRRRGIEKAWYEFRTSALTEIAADWCAEHNISWS